MNSIIHVTFEILAQAQWPIVFLLAFVLFRICYTDIRRRTIYNSDVMIAGLLSVLLAILAENQAGINHALWTLTIGFVLFYFRVCGAGDIKLLAALGAGISSQWWLPCLTLMALFGGLLAGGMLICKRIQGVSAGNHQGVPYGLPISVAGWLAVVLTQLSYSTP